MAKVNNDNVKSEKYVFINDAVNYMVVEYVKNRKKKYSKGYNSFLVCVFRMLCLIYDEKSLFKIRIPNGISKNASSPTSFMRNDKASICFSVSKYVNTSKRNA